MPFLKNRLSIVFLAVSLLIQINQINYSETVTSVHDGDSFHVAEFKNMVRIWGIDAPEVSGRPGEHRYGKGNKPKGQPFSYQSRDALKAMILNKKVELNCKGKSHKRPVCLVIFDGQDVAHTLVDKGLAYEEPRYSDGRYSEDEAKAKQKKLGIWSLPNGGERPWVYRKVIKTKN